VPDAGEQFHLGLTTQDVLDSGLTLQIRDALKLVLSALFAFEDTLLELAYRHRRTIMAGRSEGQQAAPITFGYKIAVTASEIGAHIERLDECSKRLMILTMFGAVGVQSSYCHFGGKKKVAELTSLVGERLGLVVPAICPHHRTDRFAELGNILALICTTIGESGLEIRDLQRTEVAEISEPWNKDQFSSSTMPQKQNPERSEWWEGLARLARGYSTSLNEVHQQHERDISRLAPELQALPNLFLCASAALDHANQIFSGLQVHRNMMWENLVKRGGLTMAEPVMLGLAEKTKRKVWAHQLVHDIAIDVANNGGEFQEAISTHPEIRKHLSRSEIRNLLNPERYIGTAVEQISAVRAATRSRKKKLEKSLSRTLGPGINMGQF